MNLSVESIKYSIFGNYEFMDATSVNVSKLFELFREDHFLPNMIQMLQIQQPQNKVKQLTRLQLVNQQLPCNITFLPDRIDVETNESLTLDQVINYFNIIVSDFDIKIARIALSVTAVWKDLTPDDLFKLKEKLIAKSAYPYTENLIEWSSHNGSRIKWDGMSNEEINVGQIIQSVPISINQVSGNQINVVLDINTLGENTSTRFKIENCKEFYKYASVINDKLLDNLKRII